MPKPATTYEVQLSILQSRGLLVSDRQEALRWLRHHNYYRLTAYRFPFTVQGDPDRFQPGSTFDQMCALYLFDERLRFLVFEGCKRVEISVRARWSYEIGHQLGPVAYTDPRQFTKAGVHQKLLDNLKEEITRSTEEFIDHHRNVLQQQWPPVWVICEIASFGAISKFLSITQPPRLRQDIADTYGLDEKTLCSLVHHLTVLRNRAAHHARLWNRGLTFTVQLPRKKPATLANSFYIPPGQESARTRKIYNSLVLLIYMVQQIDPTADWPARLLTHLNTLEATLIPAMGFPPNWRALPLWQALGASASTL